MKYFIDTSSFLKLYHTEEGTDTLLEILHRKDFDGIYLSTLAKVEFVSAMWRKIRMKELAQEEGIDTINDFLSDDAKFFWVDVTSEIMGVAISLLQKHGNKGLRTLDAIQLASAEQAVRLSSAELSCITSDKTLATIMQENGLRAVLL